MAKTKTDPAATVYAAFLRGINLGSTNKIAMSRLREIAESLDWRDVSTYINSGNVIFRSGQDSAVSAGELAAALAGELGKPVDVAVRTRAELDEIVAANPWPDGHPSRVNVTFLMEPLPEGTAERLEKFATEREPYVLREREIYLHYQDGLGRSKLAEKFSSVVQVSTTTRTLGTVTKVLGLCDRLASA